ncbi:ATP-binding cassette domain-containing protein [Alicyclobacillus ferrooxydans]|uniref:ABC transporter domain-containing protein n=1 Tax=Alicyclobacillus ferrooxydans TaxID=471514 RepID=A0A0P9CE72_9BACL|nr:ATP-binding cassette domain-containing protein [Alicyclobacillus ferrooxydans]KPV43902.1 hypothetical protein AN477_10105 [Alicyclobacillus ferrooxydans]
MSIHEGNQTLQETLQQPLLDNRLEEGRVNSLRVHAPLVSLTDVHVRYELETAPVLQDITFAIQPGETVLLAGPSGSGKSTLALLCAGLIPSAVEAEVEGKLEIHPRVKEPGGTAMVFQDPSTQFCMQRIGDEMAFGLENQQLRRELMPGRIAEALVRTTLAARPSDEHHRLSGGQQQKLAIASALVTEPALLILDEPTSNLDPEATQLVFDEIANLRQSGQTMLIVEHKFSPLLDVVDRLVLFGRDGRIHNQGPVREVLAREWAWMVAEGVVSPEEPLAADAADPGIGDPFSSRAASAARAVDLDSSQPAATGAPRLATAHGAQPATAEAARLAAAHGAQPTATSASQPADAALMMRHGTVRHGDKTVWQDLSIAIPRGQMTAIVGPNGVGKSTLLQAMCGLQRLAGGEAWLLGKPLSEWKRSERMQVVSYCFQNPELQFVYERVADEFANQRIADEIPTDLEQHLADFGLAGTAMQSPFALSQGQKRRLSVAVMLHDDHEVYLLDEPTYGQDAKTQRAIMSMMEDLLTEGKTVVLTTHDMNLVRRYATHVVVLADSACIFTGTPSELFADQSILQRAHLTPLRAPGTPDNGKIPSGMTAHRAVPNARADNGPPANGAAANQRPPISNAAYQMEDETVAAIAVEVAEMQTKRIKHPTDRLNPAWLVIAMAIAGLIGTFSPNFTAAFASLAVSLLWVFVVARVRLSFALKWYGVFALIYAFYIWSFTAYAAVPPGMASYRIGWVNLSWYGFREGLLMALRMFSSVGYLIVMTGTLNMTDLIVALAKNLRVAPKFAFGILAGLRLAPMLRSEWQQLKLARQLRGKDARFAMFRPVLYAIPILSQGVRMSERVAVAMEARGLVGEAAKRPEARTYFREMSVHWYDFAVTAIAVLLPLFLLIVLR